MLTSSLRATRQVVLLFPGQGSQFPRMAAGLYRHEPVFTEAIDSVFDLMAGDGTAIRDDWLGATEAIDIDDVRRAQPLLFAIDYAVGRLVLSWGVRPAAMLGHSAGELVAATLNGVFTLAEAVTSQLDRVRYATEIPVGGMLAVAATEDELRPYLVGDVAVAAVNAGRQTMIAGSSAPLATVEARLRHDAFTVAVVPATSPFHSPAMGPAATAAEAGLARVALAPPHGRLYSGYTGALMRAEEATNPRFWSTQVVNTVYFGPALDAMLADLGTGVLLLEAGPGQTLTSFARRHPSIRSGANEVVAMLPVRSDPAADRRRIRELRTRLVQDIELAAA